MNKILLGFRGKVLGAAMLLAALVPFQTAQSQVIQEMGPGARCMIFFDMLATTIPEQQQNYANTLLQTFIANYPTHLQDADAVFRKESERQGMDMYGLTASTIPFLEEQGLLWLSVMECTIELDQLGLIRPKPNTG